jgi:hypothetical protein
MKCCPLRSRLVFDRLKGDAGQDVQMPRSPGMGVSGLPSEIDTVIPLSQKILHPIKSLSDLTRQLAQFPG